MRKEKNSIKVRKLKKGKKMIKKISILIIAVILTSCTTIKEKIPKIERKACTGENKTLADVWCKKK